MQLLHFPHPDVNSVYIYSRVTFSGIFIYTGCPGKKETQTPSRESLFTFGISKDRVQDWDSPGEIVRHLSVEIFQGNKPRYISFPPQRGFLFSKDDKNQVSLSLEERLGGDTSSLGTRSVSSARGSSPTTHHRCQCNCYLTFPLPPCRRGTCPSKATM